MSRGVHPTMLVSISDFDHLTRSEARVTRRVGGGRQEVWANGAWLPFTPPARVKATPDPAPAPVAVPGEEWCKTGRHKDPEWYVNPNSGWRSCRACRKDGRKP